MNSFRVEIIENGHTCQMMTIEQIEELQNQHFIICLQVADTIRAITELSKSDLIKAERIVAIRPIQGG